MGGPMGPLVGACRGSSGLSLGGLAGAAYRGAPGLNLTLRNHLSEEVQAPHGIAPEAVPHRPVAPAEDDEDEHGHNDEPPGSIDEPTDRIAPHRSSSPRGSRPRARASL